MDRVVEHDERNADFPIRRALRADQLREPRSYTWRVRTPLDQGTEGACVGFAWAHELIARPSEVSGIDAAFARRQLYWSAQRRDRWDGGEYPGARPLMAGTSVLAGAKVVADLGFIEEYRWADNVHEVMAAVGFVGPAVLGCRWYAGMREPDARGFIHPTGPLRGGHAVLLMGVRVRRTDGAVDLERSSFLVQNSWGPQWGRDGRCRITARALASLWDDHTEICIPLRRRIP